MSEFQVHNNNDCSDGPKSGGIVLKEFIVRWDYNGDGKIVDVSMVNKGTGYTTIPSVSANTSTGAGAVLTAVNYIAQIRVADSTYTDPVGRGAAVKTDRGIIYQKGNFV